MQPKTAPPLGTAMTTQLDPEIMREIRSIVEAKAAPFTVDRFDLRVGEDADGDETIFVDVWHPLANTPVVTRQMLELQFSVREYLLRIGEGRFPLVRQHFADGQKFGSAA
jgi:hypothetical protein